MGVNSRQKWIGYTWVLEIYDGCSGAVPDFLSSFLHMFLGRDSSGWCLGIKLLLLLPSTTSLVAVIMLAFAFNSSAYPILYERSKR